MGELWDELWGSLMDLEARRGAPWSPFGHSAVSADALGEDLGTPKWLRPTLIRIEEVEFGGPGPPLSYKLKLIELKDCKSEGQRNSGTVPGV